MESRHIEATVEALAAEEAAHAAAVAELAVGIGERLGLPPELVDLLRLAARLHDVGKLGVPPEILAKPGPLSRAERHVVERHSEIGSRMLEALGLARIAPWVRHHHERWDGLGYPDGLAGERIPLPARILAVADSYCAMTSDRVYRAALSHHGALRELVRSAGTQLDARAVEALLAELGTRGRVNRGREAVLC